MLRSYCVVLLWADYIAIFIAFEANRHTFEVIASTEESTLGACDALASRCRDCSYAHAHTLCRSRQEEQQ